MRIVVGTLILALATGCTVYQSSDRQDFDANGKARATAQTASLSRDDRDLLANPCAAFNALSDDQLTSLFGPTLRLSMENQLSAKTSTCLVTTETADLSAPSVLTCSWKPVTGERLLVSDEFSPQTSETELRQNGFDVVTSTVIPGARLRMNCEAYVPTSVLVDDRRAGETAATNLTEKFSTFTRALADETLSPTDAQP